MRKSPGLVDLLRSFLSQTFLDTFSPSILLLLRAQSCVSTNCHSGVTFRLDMVLVLEGEPDVLGFAKALKAILRLR